MNYGTKNVASTSLIWETTSITKSKKFHRCRVPGFSPSTWEAETSLVYREDTGAARATERNPVLKAQKNKKVQVKNPL